MHNSREGLELSRLEALTHQRHETGTTFAALSRELGVSASYGSDLHRVVERKLAALRLQDAGRRIGFFGRK